MSNIRCRVDFVDVSSGNFKFYATFHLHTFYIKNFLKVWRTQIFSVIRCGVPDHTMDNNRSVDYPKTLSTISSPFSGTGVETSPQRSDLSSALNHRQRRGVDLKLTLHSDSYLANHENFDITQNDFNFPPSDVITEEKATVFNRYMLQCSDHFRWSTTKHLYSQ